MGVLPLLLLAAAADDPAAGLAKQMLPVYVKEVGEYTLAVETAPNKPLELKKEPVFEWTNPTREGLQQGVFFVWTRDGRPAALGCVFSQAHDKPPVGRQVIHELHALDSEKLVVTRPTEALNQWEPKAGLERSPIPDAAAPAASPGARLLQMRKLAAEFGGHSIDRDSGRTELRLLPAPLYRYPAGKTGVIDGALFALVSSSGTDPEILLLIEAREVNGKPRWEFACGRFSDRSLYARHKDKEVWARVRDDSNTFNYDPPHLYRVYADKVVSLDGKLLARCRATKAVWWGEVIPVVEK